MLPSPDPVAHHFMVFSFPNPVAFVATGYCLASVPTKLHSYSLISLSLCPKCDKVLLLLKPHEYGSQPRSRAGGEEGEGCQADGVTDAA